MNTSIRRRIRNPLIVLITLLSIPWLVGSGCPGDTTGGGNRTRDRLAFVLDSSAGGTRNIYTADSDGDRVTRVTNHLGAESDPAFGPDTFDGLLWIAYTASHHGNKEVYLANLANPEQWINRTQNPANDRSPCIAANGRIAFASDRDGDYEIYVMNFDGSNLVQVTDNEGHDDDPQWSPDGTTILYESSLGGGEGDLWTVVYETGALNHLTHDIAKDCDPAWSPDGNRIAFVSDRHGTEDLFMMDADGGNLTRLTDWSSDEGDPVWSPGGTRIAFETDHSGDWEIYILELGDPITWFNFTNDPGNGQWDPAWSPELF